MNSNLVYLWPFTDNSGNDHDYNRFNMGLNLGVSYELNQRTNIRGAWLMGSFDGFNDYYSETFLSEPAAYIDYNIMPWLSEDSDWRLYASGGIGFMMFWSNLYAAPGPSERPLIRNIPDDGNAYSAAPTIGAGGRLLAPISKQFYLELGASLRYLYDNDWLDAFESGDGTDLLATIELGLTVELGKTASKGEVIVKQSKLDGLAAQLKEKDQEIDEQNSRHQMEMQEKHLMLDNYQLQLDSLRAELNKRVVETTSPEDEDPEVEFTAPDENTPMWRVVVGSFPSQARAQQFIDRVQVDKSEMQVLYVEQINTYRVIYKSFDNVNAALKARGEVRSVISDAWVVKF